MANKLNQYCKNCQDKGGCKDCGIKETKDYIKKLKQELQAKDKALDKACEQLETFDMTLNNADFDDVRNKQEWKEWCKINE